MWGLTMRKAVPPSCLRAAFVSTQAHLQEEVDEVEAKLEADEARQRGQWRRTLQRLFTPVFLEAVILTFLAGAPP